MILDQHQLLGVIETFGQRTYSIYWPVVTQLKKGVPFCILVSLVMISLNGAVLDQQHFRVLRRPLVEEHIFNIDL